MKNFIRKWLGLPTVADESIAHAPSGFNAIRSAEEPPPGALRVNITPASNGSVIEMMVHRPNSASRRSDWTTEYIVVPRGSSLPEAVTTAITAAYLENT